MWITVFCFTFASHGNCNLVCYSPAFWTCGLACLAGRQDFFLVQCLCRCRTLRTHRPAKFFGGAFRAVYPAVLEGAAYMWHLVGQPRNGISSSYWKWSCKGFETKSYVSQWEYFNDRQKMDVQIMDIHEVKWVLGLHCIFDPEVTYRRTSHRRLGLY